jgi:polysaccharide export outer membrane protein
MKPLNWKAAAFTLGVSLSLCLGSAMAQEDTLLIGPGDQIHVQVYDTPEMDQQPRVTDQGNVPLAFLGNVHVGGLTPSSAATAIEHALEAKQIMPHPQVMVNIEQFATQDVSVIGEVKTPGTFAIRTPRNIVDVLALAGGISSTADRHISIRRHDSQSIVPFFVSNNPTVEESENVMVDPGDTVIVPKAGVVFALGDVGRPGGYVMDNNQGKITVLQLVAQAGGTNHSAVPSHAKIIRQKADGGYVEIPLQLSQMQKGKVPDQVLEPSDIIYVPFSYLRSFITNTPSVVASTSSAAIYHF